MGVTFGLKLNRHLNNQFRRPPLHDASGWSLEVAIESASATAP
jgi:hypothetical protein